MTNRIATKSPSKFSHKAIFSKCSKLTHFWDFQIFKTFFFLSFLVSYQKNFFFVLQTYFCFSKKIYTFVSQMQPKFWTLFGGGVKNGHYFPPPQKIQKSDFASIVVKRKYDDFGKKVQKLHFFKKFILS